LVRAALAAQPDDNLTAVVITVEALHNLRPALIGAEPTLSALARSRLFAGLSAGELLRLQRVAVGRHAEPGEVIVPQDELVDGLFVVLSGEVNVDRDGEAVASLGPGDPFGEHALVEGVSDVRVVATQTSDLLCFPTAALQSLLGADPHVASRLALNALRRALERPAAR
jgi:CRP-like cAMP-binding protein